MTGRLQFVGATKESRGQGACIAAAHLSTIKNMSALSTARGYEQRMKAEDQSVHCPMDPTIAQVDSALQHVTLPKLTLGLVSHPLQGAATSETAKHMKHICTRLVDFASTKYPTHQYTSIKLIQGAGSRGLSEAELQA